jgi:hypothetical protein
VLLEERHFSHGGSGCATIRKSMLRTRTYRKEGCGLFGPVWSQSVRGISSEWELFQSPGKVP